MAASTWSPTDLVNTTLSGSNLIATASGTAGGVRGKDPKRTGKYYFEYTSTTTQSISSAFGFAGARSPLTTNSNPSIVVNAQTGTISVWDYSASHVNAAALGAITTSSLLCCAIDLDLRLVWFRIGAAGNWNASASANPATAMGGIDITASGLGLGIDIYPFACLNSVPNSITANFGGSAFTGTAPSGFTAGWSDTVAAVSSVVATQVAAEVWGTSDPPMQVTQVAVEVWAPPNTWLAQSGIARETLYAADGTLRLSGVVREVLRSSGTGAGTYLAVDGLVREVLRGPVATATSRPIVVVMG